MIIFFSAFCSWLFLYCLIPLLSSKLIDKPNFRSSHRTPTPRGGGLSFVVVSTAFSGIGSLVNGFSVLNLAPFLALPLALIGLIDDRHDISSLFRFLIQAVTAIFALLLSPLVRDLFFFTNTPFWFLMFAIFFLLVSITGVINFVNFMDGLDGLLAGCMVLVTSTSFVFLSASSSLWALVGALLGFLLWNWSPAKVFMGDVGSTFLGAVFAVLVLQATSWLEALGLLLVAFPLLGDACLCVLRRLLAGQQVFKAHRLHLFQRLHLAGWPHAKVSILYIGATALLAFGLLLGGLSWVITLAALELLLAIWLDQQVAVPFVVASRF